VTVAQPFSLRVVSSAPLEAMPWRQPAPATGKGTGPAADSNADVVVDAWLAALLAPAPPLTEAFTEDMVTPAAIRPFALPRCPVVRWVVRSSSDSSSSGRGSGCGGRQGSGGGSAGCEVVACQSGGGLVLVAVHQGGGSLLSSSSSSSLSSASLTYSTASVAVLGCAVEVRVTVMAKSYAARAATGPVASDQTRAEAYAASRAAAAAATEAAEAARGGGYGGRGSNGKGGKGKGKGKGKGSGGGFRWPAKWQALSVAKTVAPGTAVALMVLTPSGAQAELGDVECTIEFSTALPSTDGPSSVSAPPSKPLLSSLSASQPSLKRWFDGGGGSHQTSASTASSAGASTDAGVAGGHSLFTAAPLGSGLLAQAMAARQGAPLHGPRSEDSGDWLEYGVGNGDSGMAAGNDGAGDEATAVAAALAASGAEAEAAEAAALAEAVAASAGEHENFEEATAAVWLIGSNGGDDKEDSSHSSHLGGDCGPWACAACTYMNTRSMALACELCGGLR